MTIKNKIIFLAATLIFLIIGCLATGMVGLHFVHIAKSEGEFACKIQDSFQELRILFEQTLMGPHDYLIHRNEAEREIFLSDYERLVMQMNKLTRQIKKNRNKQRPLFQEAMKSAENKLLQINEKMPEFKIKALEIFGLEFPKEIYKAGFYMEEMDLFSRGLEDDLKNEGTVLLELSDQAKDLMHAIHSRVVNLLILFGLVSLFIATALSYYLIQSITGRIDCLIKTSRKIKGGDLTVRAEAKNDDEIGELASSFNQMVNELVNSQEYISGILQGSGDAMCVIDTDFTILKINKQMRELIGLSDRENMYKKCYEYQCGQLCHTEGCVLKRILDGEDRVELETVKRSGHKGNIPLDLIATPLKRKGEVIGVIESFRDISGRKLIEKEIRETHEDLNQIFNTAVPLSVININYTILRVNNTFCSYFSLTPDEIIGKKCYDIWGNPTCFTSQCAIKHVCNNNKEERCEYEIDKHLNDGRDISCLVTAVSYRDIEGNILGIVENFTDITEKKKMERDVLNLQKLESIGVLAGGIAHDFNNILTPIVGNINMIMMYTHSGDKIHEFLVEAEKAAKQAKMLTQQLLTFAKGGAPILKTTSMKQIIEEQVHFALRGSNTKSSFSIAEDLWPVKIDEGQIGRVINNLIINADQAMPEGGTIKIHAENVSLGPDQFLTLAEGDYVKLTIEDQGIGISPNYLGKIFDPYFTTKQQGSGLGLATCYSIIKKHNGHITVESRVGLGTTFSLYLPASEKKIPKKREEVRVPVPGKGKILIMDDERAIRVLAVNMLTMLGYEVYTAEDGCKAIELYKKAKESEKSFDAVIIDLTIPGGMGGKETMRTLCEIDPKVKAIVASGYSNSPIMADCRKFGFRGVISKPYEMQQLSKVLHKVITYPEY